MGPRRCRRGRNRRPRGAEYRVTASMGPRRCRRGRRSPCRPAARSGSTLQWGRVVADAEGRRSTTMDERNSRLQWGRVVADAEGLRPHYVRFTTKASMGPRRCRRGRARLVPSCVVSCVRLQWGRVVADAEGSEPRGLEADLDVASMGPRRCRRGRERDRDHARAAAPQASMGPRRCRRGRSRGGCSRCHDAFALQWGRVVADAEGRRDPTAVAASASFNGAASLPTRKASARPERYANGRELQWGRVVADAEG